MTDAGTVAISADASLEAFRKAAALHDAGKFAEAEAILREAAARDPTNSDLWNARGVMFAGMKNPVDAIWCYREALAVNPNGFGIWTNLGNALTTLKHLKSAISCHRRALALSPTADALLHRNLGTSLAEAGLHGEAVIEFSRALQIKPDYHLVRWDRALNYLHIGNYRQGWSDYEVRLITNQLPKRDLPGAKWDGSSYTGKRLVLVGEQGIGDLIWVARYFPRVKALGGELFIECQRQLMPLIETMGVADALIPRDDPLPPADFYCYLCSLPGLFAPDFTTIPAPPYIVAPRDRLAKFGAPLAQAGHRLKVGIVWSGSITFGKNHERAQALIRFLQFFIMPGVQLYSLQKGPPEQELAALPAGAHLIDLAPFIDDFADTAAAIAQLDLIIMTDSAVAHLAGAMGKPVWLLLSHIAYWLWLKERTDSPWYPSIRLFRPRAPGDWDHVFDAAANELMQLARL